MSGGNRGILLAIGLVFAAASSAQAPQPKAEPKQEQAAREAQRTPAPPVVHRVELVNQASDPEGYQNPCEPGQDQRNSDLCAQWKAADAATNAAYYAWMQLWAAGAGMVGLIVTIILTLRAVRAAQQSVTVAQETAKHELRAYVGTLGAAIFQWQPVANLAVVDLKNFGQTPARNVVVKTWFLGPNETKDTVPIVENHIGVLDPGAVGNVAALREHGLPPVSMKTTIQMALGTRIRLIVEISYETIFGDSASRSITYYLDPRTSPRDDRWMLSTEGSGQQGD